MLESLLLASLATNVKLLFTLASLVVLLAFWFISPTAEDTGSIWALGKSDPARNLVYGSNNKLHPQAKLGYTVATAIFLIALWLV